MAIPRHGINAAVIDRRGYIPGGSTFAGNAMVPNVQALDVSTGYFKP